MCASVCMCVCVCVCVCFCVCECVSIHGGVELWREFSVHCSSVVACCMRVHTSIHVIKPH